MRPDRKLAQTNPSIDRGCFTRSACESNYSQESKTELINHEEICLSHKSFVSVPPGDPMVLPRRKREPSSPVASDSGQFQTPRHGGGARTRRNLNGKGLYGLRPLMKLAEAARGTLRKFAQTRKQRATRGYSDLPCRARQDHGRRCIDNRCQRQSNGKKLAIKVNDGKVKKPEGAR